jgi:hypothetical protein
MRAAMNTPTRIDDRQPARRAGWPRRCVQGAMVLVLSVPAVAHPISLNQLLRMPLEQLLRLQITSSQPPSMQALPPGKRGR